MIAHCFICTLDMPTLFYDPIALMHFRSLHLVAKTERYAHLSGQLPHTSSLWRFAKYSDIIFISIVNGILKHFGL